MPMSGNSCTLECSRGSEQVSAFDYAGKLHRSTAPQSLFPALLHLNPTNR